MYLDIFIGVVLIISIILGLKNGIFVEFLSVFGIIASFFICKKITPTVMKSLSVSSNGSSDVIFYAVVFMIVWLFVWLFIHYIKRIFDGDHKSLITRFLGGLFGIVRGAVYAGIILLACNMASDYFQDIKTYLKTSQSNDIFMKGTPAIDKYLPQIIQDKLNEIRNKNTAEEKLTKLG